MLYNTIINPKNMEKISIYSKTGKEILQNFIQFSRGGNIFDKGLDCSKIISLLPSPKTGTFKSTYRPECNSEYFKKDPDCKDKVVVLSVNEPNRKREIKLQQKLNGPKIYKHGKCKRKLNVQVNGARRNLEFFKIEEKFEMDLFDYINKYSDILDPLILRDESETHAKKTLKNLLTNVRDNLHKRKLAHYDIKPANILVNTNNNTAEIVNMKMIDFGFVNRKMLNCIKNYCPGGTPIYAEPIFNLNNMFSKYLKKEPYDFNKYNSPDKPEWRPTSVDIITAKSDIYALGIVIMHLYFGSYYPFMQLEKLSQADKVVIINKKLGRKALEKMLESEDYEVITETKETDSILLYKILDIYPELDIEETKQENIDIGEEKIEALVNLVLDNMEQTSFRGMNLEVYQDELAKMTYNELTQITVEKAYLSARGNCDELRGLFKDEFNITKDISILDDSSQSWIMRIWGMKYTTMLDSIIREFSKSPGGAATKKSIHDDDDGELNETQQTKINEYNNLIDLLFNMLQVHRKDRYDINQVLGHVFFS